MENDITEGQHVLDCVSSEETRTSVYVYVKEKEKKSSKSHVAF